MSGKAIAMEPGRTGNVSVRKIGVFLGAEVSGVDLGQPLSNDVVESLKTLHSEYGVLVFPDQDITPRTRRKPLS